ncbi:MAG: sulfatase [Planctomycetota bacterium]|jgi:arylsulfatase A-like enzyme
MNVVLVIFDSLRKDCIGLYGAPPWGPVRTPHLDALAAEALVFDRAYPESLATLPTRRAIYTGRRVYPFVGADFRLKGDFVGAPGWGPIPEDQDTLAEMFSGAGWRTGLIADVYHMFKPSKNYWRGFGQWSFLRGQEIDPYRSGPEPTQAELEHWLPKELRPDRADPMRGGEYFKDRANVEAARRADQKVRFLRQCLKNMHDRTTEEDYFNARVFIEAVRWLEQNRDADHFFLTVESFDPHEPWFVPEHYRRLYDDSDGPQQVLSGYADVSDLPPELLRRTQANYSGLVTMCDRWFGYLREALGQMGMLEETLLIVTSDHGHSIGDRRYLGKRGYPSDPAVFDVPLLVRHPEGKGAGQRSGAIVQHHDLSAEILRFTGLDPPEPIDGRPFFEEALAGAQVRDHATTGWGAGITVVSERWWLNCKVDGTGALLYDLAADPACQANVADEHPQRVQELFQVAVDDAGGSFPEYLLKMARNQKDAPGCSALAARPV